MKYIILLLAFTASAFGQPIKSPGVNGENIVNPAFRNAVLPSQSSANGKYLKSNGTAASWETVTAAPSGTGFAKVTSGVWDTPSATIPHTDITGLGTAATYATADLPVSTATQTALEGKTSLPPSIPVCTKARWPATYSNQSSGILSVTCRKRVNAIHSADNIQLVYQNGYAEINGLSAVTVKAAIEDSAGVITPVYFGGSRTATVAVDGTFTTSDVISGITLVAGREYYIRTQYSWASGNCYLPFVYDNASAPGEGRIDSVDRVDSGVITTGTGVCISPSMVLGKPTDRRDHAVIGLLGDSIMDGIPGSFSIGGYGQYDDNWSVSALGYEKGRNYSYIRLSLGGSTASGVMTGARRKLFYPYLTHVVCNLGLNDVRGVDATATIMANLTTVHKELKTAGVKRIWQCTITPDTSGSADEPTRVALNALIRAVPNPLYGVIDAADACETSRDSGTWKTSYNQADNYHPNNTGGDAIRAIVPVQFFGL